MAQLCVLQGPDLPKMIALTEPELVLGRQAGVEVRLAGTNISRRHARFVVKGGAVWLEDLGSSNGTFLNGQRIEKRTELRAADTVRVGNYVFRFEAEAKPDMQIRARTVARTTNRELFKERAAEKVEIILGLAHQLSRSLDFEVLLAKVLHEVLEIFKQADRAAIVMLENEKLVTRASKARTSSGQPAENFSQSVIRHVIEEGIGVVAEDVGEDERFAGAQSLCSMGIRSLLCVPLTAHQERAFGALLLDRSTPGRPFGMEDLNLLATIALQISVALENALLHRELVVKERMDRDLAVARDIQQGFLPTAAPEICVGKAELYSCVYPALEVSGDFYDFFAHDHGKLLFAVADVSGKGMPAALFMTMARALLRHTSQGIDAPGVILQRLNNALANDNPRGLFVTMALGLFDPETGRVELASGGHPLGYVRGAGGRVFEIAGRTGQLLGFDKSESAWPSSELQLAPGDSLCFYTDGVTEAAAPSGELFGTARLQELLGALAPAEALPAWAEAIHRRVTAFSGSSVLQDDITLLLLRRSV